MHPHARGIRRQRRRAADPQHGHHRRQPLQRGRLGGHLRTRPRPERLPQYQRSGGRTDHPRPRLPYRARRSPLKRDEVLLSVEFRPEDWQGWGAAYHKYAMREAMDIATIGCAAAVRLDGTVIFGHPAGLFRIRANPGALPQRRSRRPGPFRDARSSAATLAAISAAVEADVQPEPRGAPTGISVCTSSARWLNASLPGASSAPSNFRRPPHAENHTLHRQRPRRGNFPLTSAPRCSKSCAPKA